MKSQFLTLLLLALLSAGARAQGIDKLLEERLHWSRPFLIINITSTDCVMCRGGALNLVSKITDRSRVAVLSDDSVMSLFIDDNAEKFEGVRTLYDRKLSNTLSNGPLSGAYLFEDTGIAKYQLNNLSPEMINSITARLAAANNPKENAAKGQKKTKNYSLLTFDNRNFALDAQQSFLFNPRFQAGLYQSAGGSAVYLEPAFDDSVEHRLGRVVEQRTHKPVLFNDMSRLALSTAGLPPVMIKNVVYGDAISMGLQLNTVYEKPAPNDTDITLGVRGRYFVAFGPSSFDDVLNIGAYKRFYLIDSIHFAGKCLQSDYNFGYQLAGDNIFISFFEIDSLGFRRNPKRQYVVQMKLDPARPTPVPLKLFELQDFDRKPSEFFMRLDEAKNPLIVYNALSVIVDTKTDEKITFQQLFGGRAPDSAIVVQDARIKNSELNAFCIRDGKTLLVATYNLRNKKATVSSKELNDDYAGGRFGDGVIRLFRKNTAAPGYVFYDYKL